MGLDQNQEQDLEAHSRPLRRSFQGIVGASAQRGRRAGPLRSEERELPSEGILNTAESAGHSKIEKYPLIH